jgi:hypothetical protein
MESAMMQRTIVTGTSNNHGRALHNLLASIRANCPDVDVIVYDLGLTQAQIQATATQCKQIRKFEFGRYPPHVNIAVNRGEYAWKPILIHEVLREVGGLVLWLDAGNLVLCDLNAVWRLLEREAVVTPTSSGTVRKWTHPETLDYLNVPSDDLEKPNRNGAIVGFNGQLACGHELCAEWKECALQPACIAPPGSSRQNHRQDQSVLSALYYRYQRMYRFKIVDRIREIAIHCDRLQAADIEEMLKRRNEMDLDQLQTFVSRRKDEAKMGMPYCKGDESLSARRTVERGEQTKYVLVRPMGGLNDLFNQIAICYDYARKHRRILLIDTLPTDFKDDFFRYFVPKTDMIKPLSAIDHEALSFYPDIKQDLFRYEPIWVRKRAFAPSTNPALQLTFDFSEHYDQDCLVHHAAGRAGYGRKAMNLFYLKDEILDAVKACRNALPIGYGAVHIRNTDLSSNYKPYLEQNIGEISAYSAVFLATDNAAVINEVRNSYSNVKWVSFSKNISANGMPIHMKRRHALDPYPINVDALVDLLTIACSAKIFSPVTTKGKLSGFTQLAQAIQRTPNFMQSIDAHAQVLL